MNKLFALYFLSASINLHASAQTKVLPAWFTNAFHAKQLDNKYGIQQWVSPSFLQADFNGDSSNDIAIQVIEKTTKKKGILLMHYKTLQYFVFGAGTSFASGGDDFDWMKQWRLYKEKEASETRFDKDDNIIGSRKVKLVRVAFELSDMETAGGIIFWNGKKYIWIHQGE